MQRIAVLLALTSPSASVRYTFNRNVADSILNTACASAANPVTDLTIGGEAVTPSGNYRITVSTTSPTAATTSPCCPQEPTASAASWTSTRSSRTWAAQRPAPRSRRPPWTG
ncbi:hypothetical protein DVA67_025200 [Solirubrobacter sp. CPCC 204708]|uniref:Uncharacterized protein n=1 Tax=Solirubrobacter deserti TaxID=2282478 RepID=A0ABT4RRG3_9ACTN|nr:hypothetical protein [Solirubrobacter deserti]MBE2319299.1 hypothetical protein [Solirubrobacter deserti]MDA0141165.1 hypothetical protein [Solirubrobacter deserti]